MKNIWISVIAFLCFLTLWSSIYTLNEGQQAIVTQFGRIVDEPKTKAGLHFKTPFIQDVRYVDKRIITWDGDPNQIPTKDKKYIWVDTTARWRVVNAKLFSETVRNEQGVKAQLDSTIDGITRDTISNHNLVEAVRNSNGIIEKIKERKVQAAKIDESLPGAEVIEEEITGEIEPIAVGRERLSDIIIERSRKDLNAYGIELIDVQLRRIAYEKSVESKVYDRMISERKRIAEKIRSIGKGEEAKIKGKRNLDLKEIESTAYRKAQEIRGKGEAEAISIYAKSLKEDPEYYSFVRTLEAYREGLMGKGQLILSTDSEFLKLIGKQK